MNETGTTGNIRAETVRRPRRGFVYFITDEDAIKIGHSVYPEGRLQELQVGHPRQLRIIAAFPGFMHEEMEAHRHFANLRFRGEWFRLDPSIDHVIAELEANRARILHGVVTFSDVLRGDHKDKISKADLPYQCARLARYIERTISEMPPELHRVAERARLSALSVVQKNFWRTPQSFIRETFKDLAAFDQARKATR